MINASRNKSSFGIEGYKMPDNKAHLERPHTFMISKTDNMDFISQIVKQKNLIPACNQYETEVNLLMKKNLSIYKKQR